MIIGFWKPDQENGYLSNWYPSEFKCWGINFTTAEQALMYAKATMFNDEDIAEKILATDDPSSIKALGRKVKNYDDIKWAQSRYDIMCEILTAKFSCNKNLKEQLMNTGSADLYEVSPFDQIWGIGSRNINNVRGENLLGQALMKVRSNFIASKYK